MACGEARVVCIGDVLVSGGPVECSVEDGDVLCCKTMMMAWGGGECYRETLWHSRVH